MSEDKTQEVQVVDWQETALAKFRPLPEQLSAMAETAKGFTLADFQDPEKAKVAHDHRIVMRDARVDLQKIGKALRADALTFQKTVIGKEKEFVAMIEPEEKRLKDLEDEAEQIKEREARVNKLPARKERIYKLVPEGAENPYILTDEQLLDLDSEGFEAYIVKCGADWNEREAQRLQAEAQARKEAEDAKRKEEEAELDRKRAELAQQEAEAKAKREAEERALAEERAKIEAEKEAQRREAEARAQAEAEAKAKAEREKAEAEAEQARLEAQKKAEAQALAKRAEWQKFLADHGYTEETKDNFIIRQTETEYLLFHKVGSFNK